MIDELNSLKCDMRKFQKTIGVNSEIYIILEIVKDIIDILIENEKLKIGDGK
jgi:hypothetical protein